jgi:hypothetical protein
MKALANSDKMDPQDVLNAMKFDKEEATSVRKFTAAEKRNIAKGWELVLDEPQGARVWYHPVTHEVRWQLRGW